ncbi:MAG: diguanylate cyclase [Oscillospiraceae bacterium]|nr:diguanylate cyclase [Oscillospiraceae bacterium]
MDKNEKNTVLIVDDDNANLIMLSDILRTEYTVRVAFDGESALKIAEKYSPDLILLDIIMPGMDGFHVFNELKQSETTAHIPVIFITGLNNSDDEKRGLKLGAVDYISKPFDEIIVKLRVQHQIRIVNQLRAIEYLSMVDQLTGIPNRRNFNNRITSEWGRAIREKEPICLLMMDADYFKKYNDTYGHQQGDKALCVLAQVLSKTLRRQSDFFARWGGEEFVVLLPNTDKSGGHEIGEQLRKNMEAEEITCEDGTVTKLTVSVGLHMHMPTTRCSVDEFISKADRALYNAKNTGRNKVCVYGEE